MIILITLLAFAFGLFIGYNAGSCSQCDTQECALGTELS
jgi:hypothetical protein